MIFLFPSLLCSRDPKRRRSVRTCVMLNGGESWSLTEFHLRVRASARGARGRQLCNRDHRALHKAQISIALSTNKTLAPAASISTVEDSRRRKFTNTSSIFRQGTKDRNFRSCYNCKFTSPCSLTTISRIHTHPARTDV